MWNYCQFCFIVFKYLIQYAQVWINLMHFFLKNKDEQQVNSKGSKDHGLPNVRAFIKEHGQKMAELREKRVSTYLFI